MAKIKYTNKEGKPVPSVTTVLNILDKPALKIWANNIGLQGISLSEYVNDKAEIGTLAHAMCEGHIKGQDFKELVSISYSDEQLETATIAFNKFLEWLDYQAEFKLIASECYLVSEKHQYGGTIDCIAMLNGKLTLIDFKTCNAIYDEARYQVSAYEELAKENGYDIEQVIILRIGRDEEEGFEYIEVDDEIRPLFLKLFLGCLNIVQIKKEITPVKRRITARKKKEVKNEQL